MNNENMSNENKKSFCEAINDDMLFDLMSEAESFRSAVRAKKKRRSIALKFAASAAAIAVVALTLNITSVMALIRNIFYIPGVGITENETLSAAVLNEPVLLQTNAGDFTIEFGTKVKKEDGKCQLLLYFTTEYYFKKPDNFSAFAIIDGIEYSLDLAGVSTAGGDFGAESSFPLSSDDFPDVNEFDLKFFNTTTRIVLSEMSEEERTPHLSNEINGLTFAAYKYRNNNRILGIDTISNIDHGGFYAMYSLGIDAYIYSGEGDKVNYEGYSGSGRTFESGLGYSVMKFNNDENKNITKITQKSVSARYQWDETTDAVKVTIPIPEDGKTIYTDITLQVGGAVYNLTEVRREGDIIYFEDNRFGRKAEGGGRYCEDSDVEKALANNEVWIRWMTLRDPGGKIKWDDGDSLIKGFDPDADSFELEVWGVSVEYFGDYTITFD